MQKNVHHEFMMMFLAADTIAVVLCVACLCVEAGCQQTLQFVQHYQLR